jgi:hypothetical protein
MLLAPTIFLLAVGMTLADFLVDDLKANIHNLLHNAVYLLVGAWCLYWSYALVSRINYTPGSQISREWISALSEIAVVLFFLFLIRMTVWRQQARMQRARIQKLAATLANMLGLSEDKVPTRLEGYDGFLEEIRKRFQMGSLYRTHKKALALLEQVTAGHVQLLTLRRTQGDLGRIEEENEVKDLALEDQKFGHLETIAEKKKRIRELTDPAPPALAPPEDEDGIFISRKK